MDDLLDIEPALAKEVYHQVADLLNLEVDLLFFDTTSTYFETERGRRLVARDEHGRPRPRRDPAAGACTPGFAPTARARTPATTCPRS